MRSWRVVLTSAVIGALLGLFVLGIGGRGLMRIIAHWEGRVPEFTIGGTSFVLLMGILAGLSGGIAHGLLAKYVTSPAIRFLLFLPICIVVAWRMANELLPRPRMMFVALATAYVIALELFVRRRNASLASL